MGYTHTHVSVCGGCTCVSSYSWVLLAYVDVCLSVCMHMLTVCMCLYINLCFWWRVAATTDPFGEIQTRSSDPDPLQEPGLDPNSCSLWTRYTGDSKTDPWDDPSISTGSCSEDQTAIRFRNRVISCECSFLCIYRCRYALHVALIISCDFLLYLPV